MVFDVSRELVQMSSVLRSSEKQTCKIEALKYPEKTMEEAVYQDRNRP